MRSKIAHCRLSLLAKQMITRNEVQCEITLRNIKTIAGESITGATDEKFVQFCPH